MERCPSGRRSTPGKCVYVSSVPRVRIPPSPPHIKKSHPIGWLFFGSSRKSGEEIRVWLPGRVLVALPRTRPRQPAARKTARPSPLFREEPFLCVAEREVRQWLAWNHPPQPESQFVIVIVIATPKPAKSRPATLRAGQSARRMLESLPLIALAAFFAVPAAIQFNGGPYRLLRDGQPQTPSGPEGSSGSGDAGCRRSAGAGRRPS